MARKQQSKPELTAYGDEVVRVRQRETGHVVTIVTAAYDLDPKAYDLVDEPAVDRYGAPLPPRFAGEELVVEEEPAGVPSGEPDAV